MTEQRALHSALHLLEPHYRPGVILWFLWSRVQGDLRDLGSYRGTGEEGERRKEAREAYALALWLI